MSTQTAPANESAGTTDDELLGRIEALEDTVEGLQATVEAQQDKIEQQSDKIEEQGARIDALSKAKNHQKERVEDLEERLEAIEGQSDPNGTAVDQPSPTSAQTPLEQITNLPQHMADEQLTTNQERARFVAKDIRQYGDKRLGDWVLSSSDIRKVLSAKEDSSVHWTTVRRVMDFITEMGQDDVREKEKYGSILCFSEELVGRIERSTQSHDVVTGNRETV